MNDMDMTMNIYIYVYIYVYDIVIPLPPLSSPSGLCILCWGFALSVGVFVLPACWSFVLSVGALQYSILGLCIFNHPPF